jgi:hypothetical protein
LLKIEAIVQKTLSMCGTKIFHVHLQFRSIGKIINEQNLQT